MTTIATAKQILRKNSLTAPLYKILASRYGECQRMQKAYQKYGEETFCLAADAMNNAGILFFPMYGTLLGLIREGRLIRHDLDIDFGVFAEENEYDWEKLYTVLSSVGFGALRWFENDGAILEMAFSSPASRKVHVDFFTCRSSGGKMISHSFYRVPGRAYGAENERSMFVDTFPLISRFQPKEFMGVKVSIPTNAEALLEATYTSSWRIPVMNWELEDYNNREEVKGTTARVFVNKRFQHALPKWRERCQGEG